MNPRELFERVVVSLQEAALRKTPWLEAAVLIKDQACGPLGRSSGEGIR